MLELNNREISILVWIGGLLLWWLRSASIRKSAVDVIRAFCQRIILSMVGLAVAYTASCVVLLHTIGSWGWDNLKTTILWATTFAFVTMADVVKSRSGTKTLKGIAKDIFNATALVLFVGEFYVFPLWGELLLIPILTLIGLLLVVAEFQPEHKVVIKPLSFVQAVAALTILGYSIYRIVDDFGSFATLDTARDFGVPLLLSIMFLPFLYGLVVYTTYEQAALRMQYVIEDRRLRRYAFYRAALGFGLNLDLINRFTRDLKSVEGLDRTKVRGLIQRLRKLKRRERNPPMVSWSDGWSPYQAREFLADQNLLTGDYHPTPVDWHAESPMIDVGGNVFRDRLTYRLFGTETAATLLKLVLDVNFPGPSDESEAKFWDVAYVLIARAVNDEVADAFRQSCFSKDEAEMRVGNVTIQVGRDDWGDTQGGGYQRRVELRHNAHVSAF